MKLRVKGNRLGSKKVFDADNLEHLHQLVTVAIQGLTETVILSLNGVDPLPSTGTFSENGIVGGDLIRVIEFEQTSNNKQQHSTTAPTPHTQSLITQNTPTTSAALDQSGPSTVQVKEETNSLQDIVKKHKLKIVVEGDTETKFVYEPYPGLQLTLTLHRQTLGDRLLFNLIGDYQESSEVETVLVSQKDEEKWLQINEMFKKQIENFRAAVGLCATSGILSLPDEVISNILGRLSGQSLGRLGITCRRIHRLGSNDDLWKKLYFKEFKTLVGNSNASWKNMYAQAKREAKERRERRRIAETDLRDPPWVGPPGAGPFAGPGSNHHFPGMIGGEYDLRPTGPGFPGSSGFGPPRPRGDPTVPGVLPGGPIIHPDRPEFPDERNFGPGPGHFNPDGSFDDGRGGFGGGPGGFPNPSGFPRRGPRRDPFGRGGFGGGLGGGGFI